VAKVCGTGRQTTMNMNEQRTTNAELIWKEENWCTLFKINHNVVSSQAKVCGERETINKYKRNTIER
jgi:hypothetical protein